MNSVRGQQLQQIAGQLEMDYTYGDEWGLVRSLRDFQLFRKGRGRKISHLLFRKDDWLESTVRIFDYQYKTGKNGRKHHQTVFFVESKKLGLPQFLMKPENLFHKIGSLLGMQDIDFEAYPKFSNNYLLRSADEEYIRHIMNEEVLHYFTIERNWTMEGINYYLIFYRSGKLFSARSIETFYKKGMEIVRMLEIQ